jgi:hypothetical protein
VPLGLTLIRIDFSAIALHGVDKLVEGLIVFPHTGEIPQAPGLCGGFDFNLYEFSVRDKLVAASRARRIASARVGASTVQSGRPSTVAVKWFCIFFTKTSYVIGSVRDLSSSPYSPTILTVELKGGQFCDITNCFGRLAPQVCPLPS